MMAIIIGITTKIGGMIAVSAMSIATDRIISTSIAWIARDRSAPVLVPAANRRPMS